MQSHFISCLNDLGEGKGREQSIKRQTALVPQRQHSPSSAPSRAQIGTPDSQGVSPQLPPRAPDVTFNRHCCCCGSVLHPVPTRGTPVPHEVRLRPAANATSTRQDANVAPQYPKARLTKRAPHRDLAPPDLQSRASSSRAGSWRFTPTARRAPPWRAATIRAAGTSNKTSRFVLVNKGKDVKLLPRCSG